MRGRVEYLKQQKNKTVAHTNIEDKRMKTYGVDL